MSDQFYFKDARGRVHRTSSSVCPPGMVPHDGKLKDGESMAFPISMMDTRAPVRRASIIDAQMQREIDASARRHVERERAQPSSVKATFDAAGSTDMLAAGTFLADALAAAPLDTKEWQDKVGRALADARVATSDGAFRNAVTCLHSMADNYRAEAFRSTGAAAKDACNAASQAITGATDALVTVRSGKPGAGTPVTEEAAYEQMCREIGRRCA